MDDAASATAAQEHQPMTQLLYCYLVRNLALAMRSCQGSHHIHKNRSFLKERANRWNPHGRYMKHVDCARCSINLKECSMAQPRLRIYFGPDDESSAAVTTEAAAPDRVTIPLGEVFTWLTDAVRNGSTWLRDFDDDDVTISSDLYEVILAYQHYRRPSA